ncbi:TetR family transcriptional regulator [Ligilactobacillus salitolerans]|uniref:TetR family transcriptional regulator n=1 Tax=Ligilactobacillus salitolerans TaxID=1808352 RepID=A0A401IVI1_9LACO|nr:TetR/AcrR family transcriptional regulator C-terminal domain-containing protein [Ligilactobacillus salitolerans]GBG95539.1 TetR family transcriptional regulator [Ligilactobacillus salitolerans]
MTAKTDLRIKKSKYAIQQAFWKLLLAEDFQKITIKQILLEAQVNRATFYKYYANKYELLDAVEEKLLAEFEKMTKNVPESILGVNLDQTALNGYYQQLAQYIYHNGSKFSALLAANGDPAFINKLIATDQKIWYQKNLIEHLTVAEHYAAVAAIGMATSLISEWVKSSFAESPQEFVQIMQKIISPFLTGQTIFKK